MATRRLKVEIVGDASSLDRAFKSAERSSKRYGRSLSQGAGRGGGPLGFAMGGVGKAGAIGAGVAIGTAAAVKGIKMVVAAAKEAQVAQVNLAQAFAASRVSTARYGAQVDKAIESTSKLAGIDDELVSDSYAKLLRTTGSVAKATRGVALAADIARARGISMAAASKIVEKALNGQMRGLKAIGVDVDSMTTSKEALAKAERKFAGSAAAYGKTAAGAQDKLNVAFENLQERVGEKLLPVLTKLSLKLVELIDWSERNWPTFARHVTEAYAKIKPVLDAFVGQVKGVANIVGGMVRIVHGLFTGDWAEAWKGFKQYAIAGVGGVVKAVASLPLKLAKSLGKAAFSAMETAFASSVNRIIGILNAAIRAYNKIPIAPNIPTIPSIGGGAPAPSAGRRPDEGTRGVTTQTVNLVVDGRVLATTVLAHASKMSKTNAGQSRGRTGNPPF